MCNVLSTLFSEVAFDSGRSRWRSVRSQLRLGVKVHHRLHREGAHAAWPRIPLRPHRPAPDAGPATARAHSSLAAASDALTRVTVM